MKKAITIIGTMFITCAFATDDGREITTSQRYVETQLSNRQDTIPAKTGDKVITPTSTKGTIGEREVKTNLGDENENQNDTGITNIETVNTALDNKQKKLYKLPSVNVVTYTGTNDVTTISAGYAGRGATTSTPIYDENVNTYGNGLVRAETLNTAVQRGVSRALTRVPAGFLINNIGDVLPTTAYLDAGVIPTKTRCYKNIDSSQAPDTRSLCSTTLYNYMARGDWGVVMPYETGITYNETCTGASCGREIRGISACIGTFTPYGTIAPANLSSTLQAAYEAYRETGTPDDGSTPEKKYCYCRVTNPHIGIETVESPWTLRDSNSSARDCAQNCAFACGYLIQQDARFRGAIFGGVNPN